MPQRVKALAWFGPVQPSATDPAQLAGRDFLAAAGDHVVGRHAMLDLGR